jgi:hypothetical protein
MAEANSGHGDTVPYGSVSAETAEPTTASPSSPGSRAAHAASDVRDCQEHPGITSRPGPTGPRAALLDGPDVWEVIAALHALRDEDPSLRGESLRSELCTVTGLTAVQVSVVLDYYAAHPHDVDRRIADNTEAGEREQRPPAAGEPAAS